MDAQERAISEWWGAVTRAHPPPHPLAHKPTIYHTVANAVEDAAAVAVAGLTASTH